MTKAIKKKADAVQTVTVDAGKLSQGLKTAFEGVAMVFAAIGVEEGLPAVNVTRDESDRTKEEEHTNDAEVTLDNAGTVDDASDADDGAVSSAESGIAVTKETKTSASEKQEEPENTKAAVSQDDVTKIIVQKIKQDRGNNEKIGQILKTYGAAKVGELDPAKYEAFLTDVATL